MLRPAPWVRHGPVKPKDEGGQLPKPNPQSLGPTPHATTAQVRARHVESHSNFASREPDVVKAG